MPAYEVALWILANCIVASIFIYWFKRSSDFTYKDDSFLHKFLVRVDRDIVHLIRTGIPTDQLRRLDDLYYVYGESTTYMREVDEVVDLISDYIFNMYQLQHPRINEYKREIDTYIEQQVRLLLRQRRSG